MSDEEDRTEELIGKMEPEAAARCIYPGLELYAASAAISLKRIADALTGVGDSILTASINPYGENIGTAIQGQMVRGAAGIDIHNPR